MPTATKTRLNIIICGGGIAGLAAAGALAPHHNVTVLERKPDIREGAYGINLKPNASLVAIELLGIEVTPPPSSFSFTSSEAEAGGGMRGVPCREVVERSAEDGVEQMRIGVDAETMFGAPWYLCRRDELLQQLYRTARQRGVYVRLDVRVQSLDQENTADGRACGPVSIQTSNGETLHADLVLVADGIASKLRRYVLDGRGSVPNGLAAPGSASTKDALIVDSGQVAFRALVAWTDLAGDATLSYLTRPSHGGLYVWAGRKQRLRLAAPCCR
ncbi:hypothetical protein PANT_15c00093 [Moesziomyces antarcticus T-34]|uniref:FAD-binding domain-containing protein n=1 Tax=Pseudozyma antarctica (strain T-34) TaxID=1151754 RepID=M9LXW1_PSEA3|nr:hypothetical protein PANT_15c00093 [Moesziomyces antarcticus T-34]